MNPKQRPLILLTNDDGPHSRGLAGLAERVQGLGEVWIVVPEKEVSACGHQITLHAPIRAFRLGEAGGATRFAVNGTPADCVKLAILEILPRRPDLVLSGINPGSNLGMDVIYSGTVAAAGEGALVGISSAAFSLDCVGRETGPESYDLAGRFAAKLASHLLAHPLPHGTFLNVNVPATPQSPARAAITRQGRAGYDESYEKMKDPRGRVHYWIAGAMRAASSGPGTDDDAVRQGLISVTPLQHDLTDHAFMSGMVDWPIWSGVCDDAHSGR